jgi:hypothetical protein
MKKKNQSGLGEEILLAGHNKVLQIDIYSFFKRHQQNKIVILNRNCFKRKKSRKIFEY